MSRYNRDPYERNNSPYNRLQDDGYRTPPPSRNDYYRNPSSPAASGGYRYKDNYNNQSSGYSNNYNQGYDNYNQGYDNYNNQGSNYNQGYDNYNNQGSNYNQGYSNNGYANTGISKPPPAATKPLNAGKTPKNEKVRSALFNPEVRRQLEKNQKKYTPYFIYAATGIQIFIMLLAFILNFKNTGKPITDMHENLFIGPSPGVLISLGARYIPCMKDTEFNGQCPYGIKGTVLATSVPIKESGKVGKDGSDQGKVATLLKSPYYCSEKDVCGFGGVKNQYFRFITAIFVHSGLFHIGFNLVFQIRTGLSLERDFGTWRIAIIYMASGIFGFMFQAKSLGNVPTVGCSGSLYGLLACILLDLIQNWKLVIHPVKDLIKLMGIIILSFGIGFLPYFDNFAHIGGFIMGFLTGLIFLPTIIFSKSDGRIKKALQIGAIFVTIFLFIWVSRDFITDEDGCEWCKNLNCAPFIDKCKA